MQMLFGPHRKHTYGPPRHVAGTVLRYVADVRTSQETHLWATTGCYGDVADVRTSQETHVWATTGCYGDVADVRTSQETHVWATTGCYGDSFMFIYVADVRTSQETRVGHHGLLRGQLDVYICS
jgi:hypothetical protein